MTAELVNLIHPTRVAYLYAGLAYSELEDAVDAMHAIDKPATSDFLIIANVAADATHAHVLWLQGGGHVIATSGAEAKEKLKNLLEGGALIGAVSTYDLRAINGH